ncbi:MAG TPA: hypothetical protein VIF83_16020 [Gemmatimonadaceae bacterium]
MRFRLLATALFLTACAHPHYATSGMPVEVDMETVAPSPTGIIPVDTAANTSCTVNTVSPARVPNCLLSAPSIEETAAFSAEAERLASHIDPRCQLLGAAISQRLPSIMMFDRAIVRKSGLARTYGVGFSYEANDEWLVRIARRFNELTDRSISEKLRTLRHEVSHSLGAPEVETGQGWTASEYADRCA